MEGGGQVKYKRISLVKGHLIFTSAPLQGSLAVVGAPLMEIWLDSSDTDADIFVYMQVRPHFYACPCHPTLRHGVLCCWLALSRGLQGGVQDYDPKRREAHYITEGQFRASHRAETTPSPDDPRRLGPLVVPPHSHPAQATLYSRIDGKASAGAHMHAGVCFQVCNIPRASVPQLPEG